MGKIKAMLEEESIRGKMHAITPETKMKQQDAHIEHLNEELKALKANYNFTFDQLATIRNQTIEEVKAIFLDYDYDEACEKADALRLTSAESNDTVQQDGEQEDDSNNQVSE